MVKKLEVIKSSPGGSICLPAWSETFTQGISEGRAYIYVSPYSQELDTLFLLQVCTEPQGILGSESQMCRLCGERAFRQRGRQVAKALEQEVDECSSGRVQG